MGGLPLGFFLFIHAGKKGRLVFAFNVGKKGPGQIPASIIHKERTPIKHALSVRGPPFPWHGWKKQRKAHKGRSQKFGFSRQADGCLYLVIF